MDDTTAQHRGKHVYGKGCHHDAVRSAHKHVVFRWGHRWVVLAISVNFPSPSAMGLPVLCGCIARKTQSRRKTRHKTAPVGPPTDGVLIHWFPQRKFVFLGDGGYASHELADFVIGTGGMRP